MSSKALAAYDRLLDGSALGPRTVPVSPPTRLTAMRGRRRCGSDMGLTEPEEPKAPLRPHSVSHANLRDAAMRVSRVCSWRNRDRPWHVKRAASATGTTTGGPNELVASAVAHRVGPKRPLVAPGG
jgi:hypothetical protein